MSQIEKISRVLAIPPIAEAKYARDDWLDVAALFRIIRRRAWLILLVGIVVIAAGLPLILISERTYTASTKILIDDPASAPIIAASPISKSEINLTTESERLLSRDIALQVIIELGIDTRPEFNPQLRPVSPLARARNALHARLAADSPEHEQTNATLARVFREFFGRLTIWRAPGSDVISVGFSSQDPELAAQVPNILVRTYLEERLGQSAARIQTAEDWLGARIDEQQQRLADALRAADVAKADSKVAFPDTLLAAEMLTRLSEAQRVNAKSRNEIEIKLAALEETEGTEERAATLNSPLVVRLQQDLDGERAGLAQLRSNGGVQQDETAFQSRIRDLEARLEAELTREERRLNASLIELEQNQVQSYSSLAEAQEALVETRRAEAQLEQMQRAVDNERSTLEGLELQRRALRAQAQLPATEIEILSPATVPLAADGRGRAFYLILLTMIAGLLALTAAFGVEMIDRSVRSREQLRGIPHLRIAGFLPALPWKFIRALPRILQCKDAEVFRDAVRSIILALDPAARGGMPPSILVTSPLPGEGKTTVAIAVATELAQAGTPVLLIDADLRHGTLAQRFGLDTGCGLRDVLTSTTSLEQAIKHDKSSGISLLPLGSSDGRYQIERNALKSLLRHAASIGYTVIFDGSPSLVTNESLVLASLVTRTLIVIRWGRTSVGAVEAAVERLSCHAEHDIDAVISQVDLKRQALYGYRDGGEFARSFRKYYARRC
ncbi:GumC family protein [Paracoccus liaowanqingii]|nr:Wzz/FepE/Etk N-terminal domain-containing protein [Paracoccus liaowanqingii]